MKATPCILIAVLLLCGCSQKAQEPVVVVADQRTSLITPPDKWKAKFGEELDTYQTYTLAVMRVAMGKLATRLEVVESKTELLGTNND